MTDYSARSAAIRAARASLGAASAVGEHFTVTEHPNGRFSWAPVEIKAVHSGEANHFVLNEAGQKAVAEARAKKPRTPQVAALAGMTPLGIAPPPTEEERALSERHGAAMAKAEGRDRDAADRRLLADAVAGTRMSAKHRAALDAARAGHLPAQPDFSADTHKRWRPKLAAVVAMAEGGDVMGLRAYEIKPVSTSPKAIARYRDLAVIALESRRVPA